MEANSSGILSVKLSDDAAYVRGAVAEVGGLIVQSLASLATGFAIAFVFNWRIALLVIGGWRCGMALLGGGSEQGADGDWWVALRNGRGRQGRSGQSKARGWG